MRKQKDKQQANVWDSVLALRLSLVQIRLYSSVFTLAIMLSMGVVGTATATTTSKSANYSVTETQFGGGSAQQCSTNYCSKSSAGDTTVGRGSSANYTASFGANTTDVPLLQVIANGGQHALGVLDIDETGTAVSTVSVRHYLMAGYALQLTGSAPSQGTHTIHTLSIPTESQHGAEQFGVNLVANSTPNIGQDPTLSPSGDSAMDFVAAGYKQTNKFKYVPGDILAQNTSRSGEMSFTLSMIFNVSNVTPGGSYKGDFSAVVVPLF